jgi:hypothetical protein
VFESLVRQIVVRNFHYPRTTQNLGGTSCLDRPARMNDNGRSTVFDTICEFLGKGPLVVVIEQLTKVQQELFVRSSGWY